MNAPCLCEKIEQMISHKHKFIFIHIPKCAGSSIKDHFFEGLVTNWEEPNYEVLYGWCPKRKIHLQHATAQQLLETALISKDNWDDYFKFTFVRNPWDRAYSDYLWIMQDRNIKGTFKEYMDATGAFKKTFTNNNIKEYRGEHKLLQTDFFDSKGIYKMDFVGRFENLDKDMQKVHNLLGMKAEFLTHSKENKDRKEHYSFFYGNHRKKMVEQYFKKDIEAFGYTFENRKTGLQRLKDLF